jgi:ABC-2 type transport system ATP-binding protein
MMQFAIKTKNLSMDYPIDRGIVKTLFKPLDQKKFRALQCINLEVKKSEIFGLIGPNGAGKTTLIKILSTLLLPNNGTASINDYDILKNPGKVRESVGLITSEERSFYWRLTGRQNLKFFANLHNLYGKKAEEAVNHALSLVGLKDKSDKRYDSFSTGMKQRLLFARGLLNQPSILFMDEPIKGMDIKIAKKMKNLILELKEKRRKTIFLTTHDMRTAEELCDRIAILNNGKILMSGRLDELKKKTKEKELDKIFFKLTK